MPGSPTPKSEEAKRDSAEQPASSDKDAILKQVEFYFSDNNLPFDKFLWTESRKNDGWVPIKVVHSFKRMRHFEPYETVVEALRASPELLEVSDDGERVRRRTALVAPDAEESRSRFARTVYAKNFGAETPTLQFDIEKYFNEFAPTNQVRLRRSDDGAFKSSVFVEFQTLEDATRFVEQDPKPRFGDDELLVMSKQAYVEMKSQLHNFADKANGRRKPKFNAFKEMRHQEARTKGRNGKGKQQRGRRAPAPKRKSRDDEGEREGAPEGVPEDATAAEPAPEAKKARTDGGEQGSEESKSAAPKDAAVAENTAQSTEAPETKTTE